MVPAPRVRPEIPAEERDLNGEDRERARLPHAPQAPQRNHERARLTGRGRQLHDRFLVGSGRVNLALHASFAHHQDPVRERENLGQIARHHQAGGALIRFLPHDVVDFILGADVDALGRLVEQEHPWIDAEPARQHDLLLIATAETIGRRLDPGRFDAPVPDETGAEHALVGPPHQNRSVGGRARQHEIVPQHQVEQESLSLPVFRHERHARADSVEHAPA